jgi:hypothetical protein
MIKQGMVHPYNGVLLTNKKEQTTDTHNSLDESINNYAEGGRGESQSQKVPSCVIVLIEHLYMAVLQK